MKPVSIHSKEEIAAFLRRTPLLHLYSIGDLDDFFWPYTLWYAAKEQDQIAELALLYTGQTDPTLLAITEQPGVMQDLLRSMLPLLPRHLYAHLSPEVESALSDQYMITPRGLHYKMALLDSSGLDNVDSSATIQLLTADAPELQQFYDASYPGNWFDPRMLETGCYYGVRRDSALVSVAGIHVFSPKYRVAALGNITTHPDFRGQGLATQATAALCRALLRDVDLIGLNVHASNSSAIACYKRLGFDIVTSYGEYSLDLKV